MRIPPRLVAALPVVAVVAAVLLLLGRGSDGSDVRLALDNASGLQDGSQVSVGGVQIGQVSLRLGKGDAVLVDAHLDKGKSVPRNAQVAITAVNFLGQKQVSFSGGDRAQPAPDGYTFPASRITTSTDLDQVLDTLDADTRTRLAILVNEAGASVVGRKWDISHFVQEVPTTLADANVLLDQLVGDNHTLSDLVVSSDRFVASTTAKRADLVRLVDTLGQTSKTVETKRAQLKATLEKAPRTLVTLQRFLTRLKQTTVPLGPAAREISAAAPVLSGTLAEVDGFRRAADPTLKTATSIAPTLTRLAAGATPVLRRATPTVDSLAQLSEALPPLSRTLDGSADNLIATLENWSQAIQLRDGVSHIFRGEATVSPDLLTSALDRLAKPSEKAGAKSEKAPSNTAPSSPSIPAPHAPTVPGLPTLPSPVKQATDDVTKAATDTLKKILPPAATAPAPAPSDPSTAGTASLLDYLLGG